MFTPERHEAFFISLSDIFFYLWHANVYSFLTLGSREFGHHFLRVYFQFDPSLSSFTQFVVHPCFDNNFILSPSRGVPIPCVGLRPF